MKHKLLIVSTISIGLFTFSGFVVNNQKAYAVNYEVYNQGFRNKEVKKYFRNWKTVILTEKCTFKQKLNQKNIKPSL